MSRILSRAAAVLVMVSCVVASGLFASAEDQVQEITNAEDLMQLLKSGGEGRITEDIVVEEEDFRLSAGKEVTLHMEARELTIKSDIVKISGVLTVVGKDENRPADLMIPTDKERGTCEVMGTLILDNANLKGKIVGGGGNIYCKCGVILVSDFSGNCVTFFPSPYQRGLSQRISSKQFHEILESGKLLKVTCDGYVSDSWIDEKDMVATEWEKSGTHSYTPCWEAAEATNAASNFGEGYIWKVLTLLSAAVAILFAVLYFKKNSEKE